MSNLATAALNYAARGWQVFPCRPRAKTPATAHGFKDATADAVRISAYWRRRPDANIAMATGASSGVFVIDVDVKNGAGGEARWHDLCRAHGWRSQSDVLMARTPSGGRHLYFRHVAGVTNSRGALPAGVDVRGDGGYVLLPPSRLKDCDQPYAWLYPDATDVMEAPAWLLDVLDQKPERSAVLIEQQEHDPSSEIIAGGIARVLADAVEGERNNRLFWAACRMFDRGSPEAVVEVQLLPLALQAGLGERESLATIRSAAKQQRRPEGRTGTRPYKVPTVEQLVERRRRFMGV
jgi:hypothetical protein